MFNNMGGKIRGLAKIICIVGMVASAIAGIVFMVSTSAMLYGELSAAGFFGGLLVSGLGFLFSWVGSFFMCGFGELIQSSSETAKYTKAIYESMNGEPASSYDPAPSTSFAPTSSIRSSMPTYREDASSSGWICSYCGTENVKTSFFCKHCGTKK